MAEQAQNLRFLGFQLVRVRHTESPPSFRSYIN